MTAEMQERLRSIPQVDSLLREPPLEAAAQIYGRAAVLAAVRKESEMLRQAVLGERPIDAAPERLCHVVLKRLEREQAQRLQPVINATGVALHTNLGRAPLAKEAVAAISAAAAGYTNLEYDAANGVRFSRNAHVEPLLCDLCGCEGALVVNNNAAALLLALSTFAKGKEIAVSRGELVEIGDGFRVPEIMEQSGGRVLEVGSTNKTHAKDYEDALKAGTVGMLLKVHTSNFRLVGFTESVPMKKLAELGARYAVPTLYDVGSGALLDGAAYPFAEEPTVPQALAEGADIVCFSGDKLLGGPQAGILLGKKELVEQMRKNPLARALRIDKLSLAALEATLALYRNPDTVRERVPVLKMLCAAPEALREKAERLCGLLAAAGCSAQVVAAARPVGGGAVPGQVLAGSAVALSPRTISVEALERVLRNASVPIVGYLAKGALLLDVSTMEEEAFALIAQTLSGIF